MRWQGSDNGRRDDLQDVRGTRPARGGAMKLGGGSLVVVIIAAVLSQVTGINLMGLVGGGGAGGGGNAGGSAGAPAQTNVPVEDTEQTREMKVFLNRVMNDVQDVFAAQFSQERLGQPYRLSKLKVFAEAVQTSCGVAGADTGPFYCPGDEFAYLDMSFFKTLADKLDAPGDFAQAYVIAHEMGHHAQKILGVNDLVAQKQRALSEEEGNQWSVRQELQADCYAGVWGHYKQPGKSTGGFVLEPGDIDEGIKAALEIGDDRLQTRAGGGVNPEQWTHGSSAQRIAWFRRGLEAGKFSACDTFSGAYKSL